MTFTIERLYCVCKMEHGLLLDIGCRTDSENIYVELGVIVGCASMHSKHTAGVTESLGDSLDIFLILAGEISSTWVKLVQNGHLIGCISTREGENTLIGVIDLSEYGHLFNNR
jgi:hypothetical protein